MAFIPCSNSFLSIREWYKIIKWLAKLTYLCEVTHECNMSAQEFSSLVPLTHCTENSNRQNLNTQTSFKLDPLQSEQWAASYECLSQFQTKIVILLPMDPLCLPISDSQPCPGTLRGSLRGKVTPLIGYSAIRLETEPWTTRPAGLLQLHPAEGQLDMGVSSREADAQKGK